MSSKIWSFCSSLFDEIVDHYWNEICYAFLWKLHNPRLLLFAYTHQVITSSLSSDLPRLTTVSRFRFGPELRSAAAARPWISFLASAVKLREIAVPFPQSRAAGYLGTRTHVALWEQRVLAEFLGTVRTRHSHRLGIFVLRFLFSLF